MAQARRKESARTTLLRDWLERYSARPLWEKRISPTVVVSAYMIGGRIAIVTAYGGGFDGWDIYTAANTNETGVTLRDAEQRLGLTGLV